MGRVHIIGAGGVGKALTLKCADLPQIFTEICLASRKRSCCEGVAKVSRRPINTAAMDGANIDQVVRLVKDFRPHVVVNAAPPSRNLPIMSGAITAGAHY